MALPTLNTPKFKVKVYSEDNKEYQLRPFLVKEAKLLLIAQQSEDPKEMIHAMQDCVTRCSDGKLDGKKLPFFDLQHIFIQLRIQSVGAITEFKLVCGECNTHTPSKLDLNQIELQIDPNNNKKIMLTPEVGVMMKYPSAEILADLEKPAFDLVVDCIDKIFDQNEVYDAKEEGREEVIKFVEGLTNDQFELFSVFFKTVPKIQKVINYKCKTCEKENVVVIDGVQNFFG